MSYTHSEVAHNFAHQTGQKKNGSSLFYTVNDNGSSTIYSYGTHFAIAHILEPAKYGLNVVLFTEATYSNSTAKHKNHVDRAISHFDRIYVPNEVGCYIDYNGNIEVGYYQIEKDIKHYNSELETFISKHINARKYTYIDNILGVISKAKKYAELFNCKHKLKGRLRKAVYNNIDTEQKVLSEFFSDSELQKIKDKREAQRQKQQQKLKRDIKRFRQGKVGYIQNGNYTYLRSFKKDNGELIIQTSKGIKIPENEGKIVWNLMQKAKNKNTEFNHGLSIAGFNIDKITGEYIKAGCHTITYKEAQRLAKQIWIK